MELHPKWKEILTKAWSIRFIIVAGVLSGIEATLQIGQAVFQPVVDGWVKPGMFAALSGLFASLSLVARVVAQKDLP